MRLGRFPWRTPRSSAAVHGKMFPLVFVPWLAPPGRWSVNSFGDRFQTSESKDRDAGLFTGTAGSLLRLSAATLRGGGRRPRHGDPVARAAGPLPGRPPAVSYLHLRPHLHLLALRGH